MSEKKTKADRKLKVMTEEADARSVAEEQAKSISKMYEDRDKKVVGAKDHLVSQLRVTSDKYRTANGVMSALSCVREVAGDGMGDTVEQIAMAKSVATEMAAVAEDMATKARGLSPDEMDQLCDDFYDKEFSEHDSSIIDMVAQLMILQLCQNIGPNAEDIVDFFRHSEEEIEKARETLVTFCKENDLDFLEICGEC